MFLVSSTTAGRLVELHQDDIVGEDEAEEGENGGLLHGEQAPGVQGRRPTGSLQ